MNPNPTPEATENPKKKPTPMYVSRAGNAPNAASRRSGVSNSASERVLLKRGKTTRYAATGSKVRK